jgi:hypothetical protein
MTSTSNLADAAKASRSIARRIMAIAQNRLELFCLEVREERERAERAVFMVFGAGISLLLAGVATPCWWCSFSMTLRGCGHWGSSLARSASRVCYF